MARSISFNSISLQDGNVSTVEFPHELSAKQFNIQEVGKVGGIVVNERVSTKKLPISGFISDNSSDLLDARVDSLKRSIFGLQANLDVAYSGGTRRYLAVCNVFEIGRKSSDITRIPFKAEFVALGNGKDIALTTPVSLLAQTADIGSTQITLDGSTYPRPKFTLTLNSTGNTAVTDIQIKNETNGQLIKISGTLVNNDVFVIDCDALAVTKNGTVIDYTGVFPEWTLGNVNYSVTITATAKKYDFKIEYYKQWL